MLLILLAALVLVWVAVLAVVVGMCVGVAQADRELNTLIRATRRRARFAPAGARLQRGA